MADLEWIAGCVRVVRGFGVPEAGGFSDLPDEARVLATIRGNYAPYPDCAAFVSHDGDQWDLDHGAPVLPFVPATFLIACVDDLGFLTGAMHIAEPWTSEPGTIHAEHFEGQIVIQRFDADLDDALDAIYLDDDAFNRWHSQHCVSAT